MWHITRDQVSPDSIPQWSIKLTAVIAVLLVGVICAATRNMGTRASVLFTTIKVCGFWNSEGVRLIYDLILLMVIGLFIGMSRSLLSVQRVRGKTAGIIDVDHHFGSCTTS